MLKEEVIATDPSGQPVINVVEWLSRTTLDIIGEGMPVITLAIS